MRQRESGTTRGWGPFTGGQLTAIVIAVVAMVMFPVGAWAVSGSNVFLTDAVSGKRATVNPAGSLNVAQASPKTFVNRSKNPTTGHYEKVVAASPGHALVITSVVFNVIKVTTPGPVASFALGISTHDASCTTVAFDHVNDTPALIVNPGGIGPITVPFQPGLVVPPGRSLCVQNNDYPNNQAQLYAYGFTVPQAAAPPGA
jgi:hypothetical protein